MIEKIVYGNDKKILIGQETFYIALPVIVSGTASSTIKAGEPITGDLTKRLSTKFTASTSDAKGILLHDVKLDSNGNGNGTIVVAGAIDSLKIDSEVLANIEAAKESLPATIIITEGSAI